MAKKIADYSSVYERLKAQSKKGGNGGSDSYITLEEGDNRVRILPGHPHMDGFFIEVFYHTHSLGKDRVQVRCLNNGDPDGDDCPICAELVEVRRSRDKGDKKVWGEQRPKNRFFMNAIDRSDEKPSVKILACGTQIMTQLLGFITDPDYGDITDVNDGLDITINRTGDGIDTEYAVKPRRKSTPLFEDEDEITELIGVKAKDTKLMDLSEKTTQFDGEPENITYIWENGWEKFKKKMEAEKEEEEEQPKKKKKPAPADEEEEEEEQPKPKKKAKPPVEEEEEEEEEPKPKKKVKKPADEEEEEEEQPKPKKKAKPPVEEEEEEEEEEAPKKKVKKPASDGADDDDLGSLEAALDRARSKGKSKKA